MIKFWLDKIMEDIYEIKMDIHIMRFPQYQADFYCFVDPSSPYASSIPSFNVQNHVDED
jgi:hypothetical protein